MPAYLQRLLDAAAPPRPGPVSLAPVIRSTSPVFDQDQLLGLDHQEPDQSPVESPPTMVRTDPLPTLAPEMPPPPETAPTPVEKDSASAKPASETLAADTSPVIEALPSTAAVPPLPDMPALAISEVSAAPIGAPRVFGEPLTAHDAPTVTALEPTMSERLEPAARFDPAPAREASDRRPAHGVRLRVVETAESFEPTAEPAPPDIADATEPAVEPAVEPARVELSPRPGPEPILEAPSPEPTAQPAAPIAPTITIGHVTVELVDEPKAAAAAPRPLTAASASVIGPLGEARAAHRLLALRRL